MAKWSWSAAVSGGDLLNLAAFAKSVREAGGAALHVDAADGRLVPGFGIGTDVARALAGAQSLPVDLHLLAEDADGGVNALLGLGCASVTVHVECLTHAHRALALIRETGISAGIAINPATPLTALEHLLNSVDRILLLATEPGTTPQALPPAAFERVKIVRENVDYHDRKIQVEVEGVTVPRDCAQLIGHGADRIVLSDPKLLSRSDLGPALKDFVVEVDAQVYVA